MPEQEWNRPNSDREAIQFTLISYLPIIIQATSRRIGLLITSALFNFLLSLPIRYVTECCPFGMSLLRRVGSILGDWQLAPAVFWCFSWELAPRFSVSVPKIFDLPRIINTPECGSPIRPIGCLTLMKLFASVGRRRRRKQVSPNWSGWNWISYPGYIVSPRSGQHSINFIELFQWFANYSFHDS